MYNTLFLFPINANKCLSSVLCTYSNDRCQLAGLIQTMIRFTTRFIYSFYYGVWNHIP